MKKTTWIVAGCIAIAIVLPIHAGADAITLEPTDSVVDLETGDTISFDLIFEFTTPVVGGGFDIAFDESALAVSAVVRDPAIGDPLLSRDPDITPGLLESWAIGDFFGLVGTLLLGSVEFVVLDSFESMSNISLQSTAGVAGPFISAFDFSVVVPEYNSIAVFAARGDMTDPVSVPTPPTLPLLLVGLVFLSLKALSPAGARRRSA